MIWNYILWVVVASSAALSAVVIDQASLCSLDEFQCLGDGACVSVDHMCDGTQQCADGSDEAACFGTDLKELQFRDPVINRLKRQTQGNCRRNQWQCRDGTCIGFDGKCDGIVDCPDGSDETFGLCRNSPCQSNLFRCTYGPCVDGTAPCNGQQDCADNSDELLPRCRNETVGRGQYKCQNGQEIPAANICDGTADCADGSDETVRTCAAMTCPTYLFQCAYGACVDAGSDCNDKTDCADGSDESDELCNRIGPAKPTTSKPIIISTGNCVLPPYPDHGTYHVGGAYAEPGQRFDTVQINITCNTGYGVDGTSSIFCIKGVWNADFPKCIRYCRVVTDPSVEYRCLLKDNKSEGSRECNSLEPIGTTIRPICREPNYYYDGLLKYMHCLPDGSWDDVVRCTPECGRITPDGIDLVIDGVPAKRGEFPWHVGIYKTTTRPYMQICGGSLISTTVVLSAAHCFYTNDRQQPASNYAVAVGKIYRPYNDPHDESAQRSLVQDIRIPSRFQGSAANFQEDIAIVILTTPFEYKTYVRPVCIDFKINFERTQLEPGNIGRVAGWGLTAANGNASQTLLVADLPSVSVKDCIARSPPSFREFITSDKICAGDGKGAALCKGDSGGGLVFPYKDHETERFYLRGIVSTAPNNDDICNAFTFTTFTQITKHEHFIKEFFDF